MKILMTFVATLAAFTSVSAASAKEPSGGHYEWHNRPVLGPNKSNFPNRVRVWVKDVTDMASCDCATMRDKAAMSSCMDTPSQSKG